MASGKQDEISEMKAVIVKLSNRLAVVETRLAELEQRADEPAFSIENIMRSRSTSLSSLDSIGSTLELGSSLKLITAKLIRFIKVNLTIDVVAVSSEARLIVAQNGSRKLHVYSTDGREVKSINVPSNDTLRDVTWTGNNHIVCCTTVGNSVVTMTELGDVVVAQTKLKKPQSLTLSANGEVLYVADREAGVYQSTDNGVTWTPLFKAPDDWKCWQAIKVSHDDSQAEEFWVLEYKSKKSRLRVYTIDRKPGANGVLTWRDVTIPKGSLVDLSSASLAYDGHANIFMADCESKTVHVWSATTGQYDRQLVTAQHFNKYGPRNLTVDIERHIMYISHSDGHTVSEFKLRYEK